jgi:hypothetical protein
MSTISRVAAISKFSGFGELRLQARDIVVADMTAVFAQMRRDAVGARLDRKQRGLDGIGMFPAARVADGGDVIDVDAEAEGARRHTILKTGNTEPSNSLFP